MGESSINSYRDLRVWQESMNLAEDCYRISTSFPRDELFGITAQLRRAAVSVPANIAEGYGRESSGAYVQFLRIAQGSLKEAETHLLLSCRLGFASKELVGPVLTRCEAIGKMLRALMRSVHASPI